MKLKRQSYSIQEAAKLLGVDFSEIHGLVGEGRLSKVPAISADSIQDFAARKRITLAEPPDEEK
jgi:hypothetical protein